MRLETSAPKPAASSFTDVIAAAVDDLGAARSVRRVRHLALTGRFPSQDALEQVVRDLSTALYPRRLGNFRGDPTLEDRFVEAKLNSALQNLHGEIDAEIAYW